MVAASMSPFLVQMSQYYDHESEAINIYVMLNNIPRGLIYKALNLKVCTNSMCLADHAIDTNSNAALECHIGWCC